MCMCVHSFIFFFFYLAEYHARCPVPRMQGGMEGGACASFSSLFSSSLSAVKRRDITEMPCSMAWDLLKRTEEKQPARRAESEIPSIVRQQTRPDRIPTPMVRRALQGARRHTHTQTPILLRDAPNSGFLFSLSKRSIYGNGTNRAVCLSGVNYTR